MGIITAYGYETAAPHPIIRDTASKEDGASREDGALFMRALSGDKKKKAGKLTFVVPTGNGAELVSAAAIEPGILERIINGA
jgi:3-dehydroquinate synthetase